MSERQEDGEEENTEKIKKKGGEENDREAKIIIVNITIKKNIFTT